MHCPACKEPVTPADRFCEACLVGLAWAPGAASPTMSFPEIQPGAVIQSVSFETHPLPGRPSLREDRPGVFSLEPVRGGSLATAHRATTGTYVDLGRALRDLCVRATFTPIDPGARLGLVARHSVIGGIQLYNLFDLSLTIASAWCARAVQTPRHATSTKLGAAVSWAGPPSGQPIELELRVAGPTMRAYVDGRFVLAAHDASFGAGSFGIRVGRENDIAHPVRVLCHGYELRAVAP